MALEQRKNNILAARPGHILDAHLPGHVDQVLRRLVLEIREAHGVGAGGIRIPSGTSLTTTPGAPLLPLFIAGGICLGGRLRLTVGCGYWLFRASIVARFSGFQFECSRAFLRGLVSLRVGTADRWLLTILGIQLFCVGVGLIFHE